MKNSVKSPDSDLLYKLKWLMFARVIFTTLLLSSTIILQLNAKRADELFKEGSPRSALDRRRPRVGAPPVQRRVSVDRGRRIALVGGRVQPKRRRERGQRHGGQRRET